MSKHSQKYSSKGSKRNVKNGSKTCQDYPQNFTKIFFAKVSKIHVQTLKSQNSRKITYK